MPSGMPYCGGDGDEAGAKYAGAEALPLKRLVGGVGGRERVCGRRGVRERGVEAGQRAVARGVRHAEESARDGRAGDAREADRVGQRRDLLPQLALVLLEVVEEEQVEGRVQEVHAHPERRPLDCAGGKRDSPRLAAWSATCAGVVEPQQLERRLARRWVDAVEVAAVNNGVIRTTGLIEKQHRVQR
eukprot:179105-Chlamydomonas_euryale.AAC.1